MFRYYLIVILITCSRVSTTKLVLPSVDNTYEQGVLAYSNERWSKCIEYFEESLHLYKLYKSIVNNCRLTCNSPEYKSKIKENIEDLKIYERFFVKRDCLYKCQESGFNDMHINSTIRDSTIFNLEMRRPYEYLHVCYFEMNALPKAASAVFTHLVVNPDNEQMQRNLKYYIEQPEVDANEVVDLQSEDYTVMYKMGIQAYKNNNWGETIASMEEVVSDYILWENMCRADCERQPEQESSSEFVVTVSNNIASLLHCRQQCQDKLAILGYHSGVGFLADVLNYIQISYYRLDRYKEAARTTASYLVLLPNDSDMLQNKMIYSTLVAENAFEERSDIVHYSKRDEYEKELLYLFHQGINAIDSNAI
ncbi:cartilage-associated protein-like [Hyposmocoma kahamanoa]|uniref:cartilage-associated protein-like n=1 Tax=Hyposmocoma kahamanoa TaxID=1477025 RepID=UPI000E6D7104|nr:cartilage-associated protein-like [Hyposmocoma kahamanoa]